MIGGLTQSAADRYGAATAVICDDASFSFTEIDQKVAALAGGLSALGVGSDDRVVLYLPNGWRWIIAYYAIARLGAVVVPANILLSADEVSYIAGDAQAKMVIAPADHCVAVIACDRDAGGRVFLATGAHGPDLASFETALQSPPVDVMPRQLSDLCAIGYTSGTTGRPKGAMLSNRAVSMCTGLTATVHMRREGEVVLSALPLPHVYGNIVLHTAFLCGMTLVIMERFDALAALDLITRHRVTLFEGVPTMYYYLLSEPAISKADLTSLRRCTVGGQTMPTSSIQAVERALGCPLLELWGMTEVAGPATSHSPYLPNRHGSIGLAFPGMESRIVSLDDPAVELPNGEPGELVVRGPLVMDGYYNNPEATAEAISSDGWLRTGDVATKDAEGYLFVLDRKKDLIITAGYNIYPAELEQVIAAHPAVAMVAVASVQDDLKGELAKAFVVCRPGAHIDQAELLDHCRRHLASYKVPRLVEFVADLPKTSTGKIMRRALREGREIAATPA